MYGRGIHRPVVDRPSGQSISDHLVLSVSRSFQPTKQVYFHVSPMRSLTRYGYIGFTLDYFPKIIFGGSVYEDVLIKRLRPDHQPLCC
jgi:hypothetical protein